MELDYPSRQWDPDIQLQKSSSTPDSKSLRTHPGAHHPRQPDIALKIRVSFQVCLAPFDGAILKVARTIDIEPDVFQQAYEYGVCPRILYNCTGYEHRRNQYHCWMTEPTIPFWMNLLSIMALINSNALWLPSVACSEQQHAACVFPIVTSSISACRLQMMLQSTLW